MTKVICFWEAPRSRGTSITYALYYGLKEDGFTCLFRDESLHWRRLQNIEKNKGLTARQKYLDEIKLGNCDDIDFVIQKEQAKWLFDERSDVGSDLDWITTIDNVILIRDAHEMVVSHQKKLWQTVDLIDRELNFSRIGIEQLFKLFIFLYQRKASCVIVDSNELLRIPEYGIRKLCEHLKIPFSKRMLTWGRPEIEPPPWGLHWYEDIMKSEGFYTYQPKRKEPLSPRLDLLVRKTQTIVDRMREYRLHVMQPELFAPQSPTSQ